MKNTLWAVRLQQWWNFKLFFCHENWKFNFNICKLKYLRALSTVWRLRNHRHWKWSSSIDKIPIFSSVSPSAYKTMWPYAEDMIERPWFTHFISIVMFKEERAKTINNFIFCIFHNMKLRKFFISPRFRNCDDDDIFR